MAKDNPAIVQQLMARLQAYNATNIPQDNSGVDPKSNPALFGDVWTPWRGNPDPQACDWPPRPPPSPMSNCDSVHLSSPMSFVAGWCSGPEYSGPPLQVQVVVDSKVANSTLANIHRAIAGDHGFNVSFAYQLIAAGSHTVDTQAFFSGQWQSLSKGHVCVRDGRKEAC